ncbi:unnamed protein product [Litomosoides sigmodontis]|uniref:Non-structural maintenance of chromosomes element 4 n=1 Tax=Litomosoides sigmodontis TaxID=42156 RepID=A0A3P6SK93_LITSI|nr:unnamed protein product [Litomosoides sigmodontis]
MDEDLEIPIDVDKCGASDNGGGENELEYHETAQHLCEKIDRLTMEVSEGDETNDDLRSQQYLQETGSFEEDFAKTQSCRYMMTDAKLTKSLSKLIVTEVQSFHNISTKKTITLHSFAQTLKTFMKNECGLIEDGKITIENQQSGWAAFGTRFINVLNLPPALSCLGPLLLDAISKGLELKKSTNNERKRIERAKQKKDEIVQLQEVEDEELERRTDPLAKQLDNVMHCLKSYLKRHNTKSINYFEFCFHPTDFSRSVENAFYTSFLLKENKVGLYVGGDNVPRLSLISNAERKTLEGSTDQDKRGIISFSYNDWQEIVKLLNITTPVISDQ